MSDTSPPRRLRPGLPAAALMALALSPACVGGRARGLADQMAWVANHPGAPGPVKQAVLGKKLQAGIGMTPDAAVASWGEPDDKLDLGGGDARWIYRRRQTRNSSRILIEYTLIFNRGYLVRVLQEERR